MHCPTEARFWYLKRRMKFLPFEIWRRITDYLRGEEVFRLLFCGNRQLTELVCEGVVRFNLRYDPHSKVFFPRTKLPFKHLISLSIGPAHPQMTPLALSPILLEAFVPPTVEELVLEESYAAYDFLAFSSGFPSHIRSLVLKHGGLCSKHNNNSAGFLPVFEPKSVLVELDIRDAPIDIPFWNNNFKLPETLLVLHMRMFYCPWHDPKTFVASCERIGLDANSFANASSASSTASSNSTDSTSSTTASSPLGINHTSNWYFSQVLPPHLHTLSCSIASEFFYRFLPASLTNLEVNFFHSFPHESTDYDVKYRTAHLASLVKLTRFTFHGWIEHELLQHIPPSLTHLHFPTPDVRKPEDWETLFLRMTRLTTLTFGPSRGIHDYHCPTSLLPPSLTRVSSSFLRMVPHNEFRDLPKSLTGLMDGEPLELNFARREVKKKKKKNGENNAAVVDQEEEEEHDYYPHLLPLLPASFTPPRLRLTCFSSSSSSQQLFSIIPNTFSHSVKDLHVDIWRHAGQRRRRDGQGSDKDSPMDVQGSAKDSPMDGQGSASDVQGAKGSSRSGGSSSSASASSASSSCIPFLHRSPSDLLNELSSFFVRIRHLSIATDDHLPLHALSSFKTPLESLHILSYDSSISYDTTQLDFGHSFLRLLSSLSLPSRGLESLTHPANWIASLPRTLSSLALGHEGEMTVSNWTCHLFSLLPRSLTHLVFPQASVDGSGFLDLPRGLTSLALNGEGTHFKTNDSFASLNLLPPSLTSIAIPELDTDEPRPFWEERIIESFLKHRIGLSRFTIGGFAISIYFSHIYPQLQTPDPSYFHE